MSTRSSFAVWMALCVFGLAATSAGCAADVKQPPPFETNGSAAKKKGSTSDEEKKSAPIPAPTVEDDPGDDREPPVAPPAEPADIVWWGKIAKSKTIAFGGDPYCSYDVTFTNIDVTITTDAKGNVKSSVVKAKMTEKADAECPHETIPAHEQSYSYVPTVVAPIESKFGMMPAAANKPRADLQLKGQAFDDTTTTNLVHLRWHRTDIDAPFDWVVEVDVPLVKEAPAAN